MSAWRLSHRFDSPAAAIADRHYNRQKPGTPQFVKPGKCLVLLTDDALWVSSWQDPRYVKHAWPDAWENSYFRREGGETLASSLIVEGVAATRWYWGNPPALGMVSFVDASKVEHKRQPGRCYLKAGFQLVGETQGGLLTFQMLEPDMPPAIPPLPREGQMFAVPA